MVASSPGRESSFSCSTESGSGTGHGQGAHPMALQERLGHSSVTLDRYGHLYEGLDGQIVTNLDDVLRKSRGLAAAWAPSEGTSSTSEKDKSAGHSGGASKNRTCDLILIRDAL